jgi:DNA helicase HerA-like ATPase
MRLPNDSQRHAIYGKTGSGKTVVGLWALEKRSWLKMPWIIEDFKRDPLIARIPRLEEIDIRHPIPRQPGLYVVRPLPTDQETNDRFLWRVWERTRVGLFVDEGYMVGRFSQPFSAILTQGRSLKIPVISLSQRPSWLSPFLMSEADFHQVLYLQRPADVKLIREWVPFDGPLRPNFHSLYFDVSKNDLSYLAPVPNEEEILDRFDGRMPRRMHLLRGLMTNAGSRRKRVAIA